MPSEWIFNVTESEFETKVIEASKTVPVIVDFWAEWCGPCKALAPILERAVEKRAGEVLLAKVDTDAEQRLAMFYRVEGLPTVLAFRNGQPINEFVGMLPEDGVERFLDQISPSETEKQAKAGQALETSDPKKAEELYRQILAKDPKQEPAILGLARVLIQEDRDAEAIEILENVGPGSEQGIEVERLNAVLWLKSNAKELPDEAVLRSRVDANPKSAQALYDLGCKLAVLGRYSEALTTLLAAGESDFKWAGTKVKEAMVKVFHAVGNRSPLADEYRAKLTSLLY